MNEKEYQNRIKQDSRYISLFKQFIKLNNLEKEFILFKKDVLK